MKELICEVCGVVFEQGINKLEDFIVNETIHCDDCYAELMEDE